MQIQDIETTSLELFQKILNEVIDDWKARIGPRFSFGELFDRAGHLPDDYKFIAHEAYSNKTWDVILSDLRGVLLNAHPPPVDFLKPPLIPLSTAGCDLTRIFVPPEIKDIDLGMIRAKRAGDATYRCKEMIIFGSSGKSNWFKPPQDKLVWYQLLEGDVTVQVLGSREEDTAHGEAEIQEIMNRWNKCEDKDFFQYEAQRGGGYKLSLSKAISLPPGALHRLWARENYVLACNLGDQYWDKEWVVDYCNGTAAEADILARETQRIPTTATSGPNPFGGKPLGTN